MIGEIGPFNSGCAYAQIPIANRVGLAMISPTNSDVGLTHATPLAPEGLVASLYPTGERNYVRIFPRETYRRRPRPCSHAIAGARRVAVLSDGWIRRGVRLPLLARGAQTRDRCAAGAPMEPKGPQLRPACGCGRAGRPRRRLRGRTARLERRARDPGCAREAAVESELIANDGFLPVATLFESAGSAARGVYVTRPGLAPDRLPPRGAAVRRPVRGHAGNATGVFRIRLRRAGGGAPARRDRPRGRVARVRHRRPAAHAREARPARQHRIRLRGRHDARAGDGLPRAARRRLRAGPEHGGRARSVRAISAPPPKKSRRR